MNNSFNERTWIKPPDRYFVDRVAKGPTLTVENLNKVFLNTGIPALNGATPENLILPPKKDHSKQKQSNREDLHCNAYVEVGIVVKGEMTIWWEGMTTVLPHHSVFVIAPNCPYFPHARVPDKQQSPPHSIIWLALHRGSTMVHQCTLNGDRHLLSEYYSFTNSTVMNIARNIADELANREPHFETSITGNLLCLFTSLLRAPVLPITRPENPANIIDSVGKDPFSSKVESFLMSHYHRPLSLPQIAASVGCSPAYLCRRFRSLTGFTPFQCLRSIRLETAKHLLRSEVPIARVAEMVGIEDALYFSRVFSSYVGEPPQTYRTRHRFNNDEPIAPEES